MSTKILIACIMLLASAKNFAQKYKDSTNASFNFSGTIRVTTNGISPIPAFSLDQPAILGFLSLRKKKFSYDPETAFSTQGVPWFLNNCFRYRLIEKTKFQFRTGLIWGLGYSYPFIMDNGEQRKIAKAERFFWLELMPKYNFSEKNSISSITFIGYNFERGSVKRINFISLTGNITKILLRKNVECDFHPQLFYLGLDGRNDGFFASEVFGIRHTKLPFFLSTQINQTLTTSITPDPGFKWNISISYSF